MESIYVENVKTLSRKFHIKEMTMQIDIKKLRAKDADWSFTYFRFTFFEKYNNNNNNDKLID